MEPSMVHLPLREHVGDGIAGAASQIEGWQYEAAQFLRFEKDNHRIFEPGVLRS